MATTTRTLGLSFLDSNSEKYTQSWRNIKASPTTSEVKALANAVITNGAVFQKTPVTATGATLTTTTTQAIDISD